MSRLFFNQRNGYQLLDDADDVLLNDVSDLDSDSGELQYEISQEENDSSIPRRWLRKVLMNCKCFSLGTPQRLSPKTHRIVDIVLSVFCLLVVMSVCLSLGYYAVLVRKPELVIDKSYRAFRIPNHEASINFGALQNAKTHYTPFRKLNFELLEKWAFTKSGNPSEFGYGNTKKNNMPAKIIGGKYWNTGRSRRSRRSNSVVEVSSQYYPLWKMQVVFLVRENENILTKERLQEVHDIEKKIMQHENFHEFCYKDIHHSILEDPAVKAYNGCAPLNSLLTYFYPSTDSRGNVFYDGMGDNMDKFESALKLAMTSTHFYYYVDDKINSSNLRSSLLRTEVLFGAPLKGYTLNNNRDEQTQKFKDFVITYIDLLSRSSSKDISVLYGGQEIFDYEVESTFWNDIKLAVYALLVIFVLMLVLTSGSVWLSFWGLTSVLLSAPLAIFFYRIVFNVRALGILNGAAAFVIIGIGVDDVFVFINVFRQANHLKDPRARTLYTIKTAGKATFFTSFTTAAAFAANIASMIPAVHDFGLFMALIVANCWITVMLIMPPVLYIWYISFARCEERIRQLICGCFPSMKTSSCLNIPEDIAHFMDSSRGSVSHVTLTREITDEEADVPMLSMEIPSMQYIGSSDDDDEELVRIDPDPLIYIPSDQEEPDDKPGSNFGSHLQKLMYHGLVKPIIKGRWIIIGISGLLLLLSIGFMTQLHTSTKPPRFFKEYTNIQKLLDLKAKFSAIDNVHCFDCSAIYNLGEAKPTPSVKVLEPITEQTTVQTRRQQCPIDHFPCQVEDCCLPEDRFCDGIPDCMFGEDEPWYCRPKSDNITSRGCNASGALRLTTTDKPTLTSKPSETNNADKPTFNTKPTETNTADKPTFNTKPSETNTASKPTFNTKPTETNTIGLFPTSPSLMKLSTEATIVSKRSHRPVHPFTQLSPVTSKHVQSKSPSLSATSSPKSQSVPEDYDVCKNRDCTHLKDRPLLESGATVYVILGVKSFEWTQQDLGHVMSDDMGTLEFDSGFSNLFNFSSPRILEGMRDLCRLCKRIANNTELVRNGSAQCIPTDSIPPYIREVLLTSVEECHNLPKVTYIYDSEQPAHALGSLTDDGSAVLWLGFAFESTTSKGKSYFEAYKEYQKWESFLSDLKQEMNASNPLIDMFQASEFWPEVLMEIVAVNSAIYGVALSLIICMIAVMIFTGHILLLLIIFVCIIEMVCLVVAVFYVLGWEIGGVEAISLSILVGSSVDYCVHLVEGYILAAQACPYKEDAVKARKWKTSAAFTHIGVSIISSALTTIIAAIPLTQTTIQPFAKFGQILAINTSVCIIYSLTVCTALLSTLAPAFYKSSWVSNLKSLGGTILVVGGVILAMFSISKAGVAIPGPNGSPLFH